MKNKYLQYIPKTLQEDFVNNRVVPFIGAGFSQNAKLTNNTSIPDWEGLAKTVASYIPNYEYTTPIDTLSLFESEYSRTKLIEIMAKELKVNYLTPGNTHRAFCDLNFDTICTTNFDFLLEQTLNEKSTPFSTIVSEERLPISVREKTKLIKLHGDFNHPDKMVITEYDYDNFLNKNKVLSTYISNIFITKTLLLIGYSLDDYDIRTLWNIIGSRLGKLQTPAYVILVDATPIEISKFGRRNVKVINLPGDRKDYSKILETLFIEIKDLINDKAPEKILTTNEKVIEEFLMPVNESKLCFISAPFNRLASLKEIIYPVIIENGLTPITLDEVLMPGDIWTRKVDLLINQSFMSIIDISDNNANVMWELGNLQAKNKPIIIIADETQSIAKPYNITHLKTINYNLTNDELFIENLDKNLKEIIKAMTPNTNILEHFRLLNKGEYKAAVISVFRFLEITMRTKLDLNKMPSSLSAKLSLLNSNSKVNANLINKTKDYLRLRNQIVHSDTEIDKKTATEIVKCVSSLCDAINKGEVIIL